MDRSGIDPSADSAEECGHHQPGDGDGSRYRLDTMRSPAWLDGLATFHPEPIADIAGHGDSRKASGEASRDVAVPPTSTRFETRELPEPPQAGDYRALVVDPPWNQGKTGKRTVRPNQGTRLGYATMSKAELTELPIARWASEQAFLWLWATNSKDRQTGEPILRTAFDLLATWGFTFYTMITWHKQTGPCPFGPYQITTEHILFGYRGKATFDRACLGKMSTCFTETPTVHSAKPASFYQRIANWFPGPRLDVFARQVRDGFDGWGDEYGSLGVNPSRPRQLTKPNN